MGAIAGWISVSRRVAGERSPDGAALAPMLEAIGHRCTQEEPLFGIVDAGARQQVALGATLRDKPSGISLVLDGSIANRSELRASLEKRGYAFHSGTGAGAEAEVLLRAYQHWDKDVVKQLRGAFALAIWDARKERLMLARDRFGEKPLYLRESGGALYFGSEIKALLAAPGPKPEVDLHAVWDCLVYGYAPGPGTLFAGIRKLPPATYALWQLGRLQEVRYWIAPDRNPRSARQDTDATAEEFIANLEEAVKLSGAGAPGLFLSGGLDSSVLGALMAKQGAFRTFSLGIEGDKRSELPQAAAAAKHFGAQHREILVAPRDLFAALPRLVAQRDAPLARPSDLAVYCLAREAAGSVRAVLTGDGGDEILGGYRRHAAERLAGLGGWCEQQLPSVRKLSWGERQTFTVINPGHPSRKGLPPFDADPGTSKLRRLLYADQTGRLPDDLLERGDRMAMASSLETRLPYLDHRIAEYVSARPDELRVRGLSTKWILRQAAGKLLPPELRKRPKAGFRVPVAEWLRGELREQVLDHLGGNGSITRKYYDAASLDRLVGEHLNKKKNHAGILWTLLNLEIWHRHYARA